MIQLYATKKLLNISGERPNGFIPAPADAHEMQDWFVTVTSSSFAERFFVLYVHQPSMMCIVVKGKSIETTYSLFLHRLRKLMERSNFPTNFIRSEISNMGDHAIGSATGSKMIQELNRLAERVAHWSGMAGSYDLVDEDRMENRMLVYPHSKGYGKYSSAIGYWEDKLGFKCVGNPVLP